MNHSASLQLSYLLFPTALTVEFLLAGLVLLWFSRSQWLGRIIVTLGCLILLFSSNTIFANFLMRRLERQYTSLFLDSNLHMENPGVSGVKYIVVLSGRMNLTQGIPISSQLGQATLNRLIEGVRVHRLMPGSKLILSGTSGRTEGSEAAAMAIMATMLGVRMENVIIEDKSGRTSEQAKRINQIVGKRRFILVTSADHMPRSMALFQRMGMNPIPAPTNYLIQKGTILENWIPSSDALLISSRLCYETLAMAKAKIMGEI